MKIINLKAENVKRIQAVSITPDGSTVVIGGGNGQGKSSVLDSIMYALGGGSTLPAKPLRNGADKGAITITLDDMVVTRRFTRQKDGEIGTTLEIKRANGDKASSPQAILDDLCGKMAFDPLEFARLKPKAQLDALRELVGLDFAELDRERQQTFDRRTDVNRQHKAKLAELAACPQVEAPAAEVSVADLMAELDRRESVNAKNADLREALEESRADVLSIEGRILNIQQQIIELQEQLEAEQRHLADEKDAEATRAQAVAHLKDEDTAEVRRQIAEADATNARVRQNTKRAEIVTAAGTLAEEAERLTDCLDAIDQQKAAKMAAAPFPVPGLGFDASGVTLNGLPFDQASSAEQLRVSVAMGLALNPKLRVMLIRDGSLLDENSLALVASMAEAADGQVWIERVSDGAEVSVVIEDGHVRAAELIEA